ncbi:MAG TPA: hypothetical protein VFA70_13225, partial [Dehalococcoidia bacterium]|nr:hypothetical protein [Dehalococcoidia bacterium]
DWRGAALLTAGLSALTFSLTDDGANPRPFVVSATLVVLGVGLLLSFARIELKVRRPMLDMRVLRLRPVAAAALAYLLIGGALITVLVAVPLMSDVLYGDSTTQGGLTLMRFLLLLPLGGLAGGWLATLVGYRVTVLAGIALALGGFVWMRLWPFVPGDVAAAAPPSWQLWGALGCAGFGLGLCDGPIMATVVDAVAEAQRATAAAMLLVVWTTGMIIGLALLATQGLGAFGRRLATIPLDLAAPDYQRRLESVMHRTFDETFVAAALALGVAWLLAWALRGGRAAEVLVSPYEALGE